MATIVKSIGAGRDYATPADWEADLDNAAIYSAGDVAQGEVYGSLSIPMLTINGGTVVGLAKVILTGAPSNRHTGIEGTGAKLTINSPGTYVVECVPSATMEIEVSWLEIDMNDIAGTGITNTGGFSSALVTIHHNIVHNCTRLSGSTVSGISASAGRKTKIHNNIVYDVGNTANNIAGRGITNTCTQVNEVYNNTVYNIRGGGGNSSGSGYGIEFINNANCKVRNNIVADVGLTNASSGAVASCYFPLSSALATFSHNISDDGSAFGTGSLTGVTAVSLFNNPVAWDFHLKSGAAAIDTGTNLGSPYDIDIDGQARGLLFDIGADEFVSSGGGNRRRRALVTGRR